MKVRMRRERSLRKSQWFSFSTTQVRQYHLLYEPETQDDLPSATPQRYSRPFTLHDPSRAWTSAVEMLYYYRSADLAYKSARVTNHMTVIIVSQHGRGGLYKIESITALFKIVVTPSFRTQRRTCKTQEWGS